MVKNGPKWSKMVKNDYKMIPNDYQMVTNDYQMVTNDYKMAPNNSQIVPNESQMIPNGHKWSKISPKGPNFIQNLLVNNGGLTEVLTD